MSTSSDTTKAIKDGVERACAGLMEYCDSVQIMVTWNDGGEEVTRSYEFGLGNVFARQGQVREWLLMMDQFAKNEAKRRDRGAS